MTLSRRDLLASAAAAGAVGALSPLLRARQDAAATRRVLILGGTGFLGPHVVDACKKRGWKLTLFNRGKTRPHLFDGDAEVQTLNGNRDGDLASLQEAIAQGAKWDAVVDTSGYVPRIVKDSATLLAPAVGRYIFISTLSVYADTATEGQDEGGPLMTIEDETNEEVMANYGALKALCEKAAEAAVPGRTANLRPGLIVGPGDPSDRYTYWPARLARGGEVLAPGSGDDPIQYVDVRDLAEFVAICAADGHVGTFNVNGPAKRHVMKELVAACDEGAKALAVERPATTITWAPAAFLEAQQVSPWQDLPVWVPGEGDMKGFHTMSSAKAIAKGLTFKPALDTARDTLAWWREQPEERRAKPRAGLSPEREAEVLAAFHASEKKEG